MRAFFSLGLLQGQENCCMLATSLLESREQPLPSAPNEKGKFASGCHGCVGMSQPSRKRRESELCCQYLNVRNLFLSDPSNLTRWAVGGKWEKKNKGKPIWGSRRKLPCKGEANVG